MLPKYTHTPKEYTCTITLRYSGNCHEAINENEYREKVKESFYQETGIKLADSDISNVEVSQ
jgi:hypothetical protein